MYDLNLSSDETRNKERKTSDNDISNQLLVLY